MLTGRHLAAARVLAGLSVRDLAGRAEIGAATITGIEGAGIGPPHKARPETITALLGVLRTHGVEPTEDGVRIVDRGAWERGTSAAIADRRERYEGIHASRTVAQTSPEAVRLARELAKGGLSLRAIAARLAEAGHLNGMGNTFTAGVIATMIGDKQ